MVTLRASHWSQGDEGGGRRCRRREGGLARAASFGTLRIDCGLDPASSIAGRTVISTTNIDTNRAKMPGLCHSIWVVYNSFCKLIS